MTLALYPIKSAFPQKALVSLTSQLRRAAISTASNIAEGYGRNSQGEDQQFLGAARGSNLELQTQLYLAAKLGYGNPKLVQQTESRLNAVANMRNTLTATL